MNDSKELEKIWRFQSAAKYLSMNVETLRRAARSGQLYTCRPGGGRVQVIRHSDLMRWVDGQTESASA